MANTFNIAPYWRAETSNNAFGTLPTANNSSITTDLAAWYEFQNLLFKTIAKGKLYSTNIVTTYSLVYTAADAYRGGVLAPNGDIHFVPNSGRVGQKVSATGTVSTYSLVYTTTTAYRGGALAPNGDIHFAPNAAAVGQKINAQGTVSTYSLVYTTTNAYRGAISAPNGDLHFVPYGAAVGQKITAAGTVSTYSLVYTTSAGAHQGGVLAPNGDVHFVAQNQIGQKISADGVISTYDMTGLGTGGGGAISPYGDLYFVGTSSTFAYKIDINGVISSFSVPYYIYGAVLAPNGDVYMIPDGDVGGTGGMKIASDGTTSTYSLVYTTTNAYYGGILGFNGEIHFVPDSAAVGQKISTMCEPFSRAICLSPWLNKTT